MRRSCVSRLAIFATVWLAAAFGLCAGTQPACAQTLREFADVEFWGGPVVSSRRVTGMGGAFIGIAENADGHLINPASFGVRSREAADESFDWDFAFSYIDVQAQDGLKLKASAVEPDYESATYLDMGLNFKWRKAGFGAHIQAQIYDVEVPLNTPDSEAVVYDTISVLQQVAVFGLAHEMWHGQLVVGAGWTLAILSVDGPPSAAELDAETEVFKLSGSSFSGGVLWAPHYANYRLGARVMLPVAGSEFEGELPAAYFREIAPERVVMPMDVGVGASWLFGDERYNPVYTHMMTETQKQAYLERLDEPDDARRWFSTLLVATDLVVTFPFGERSIPLEALLAQEYVSVVDTPTPRAHAGAETEVYDDYLVVRGGTYWEPSRTEEWAGRAHLTGGVSARLPLWFDWKVGVAADYAADYFNWGLGVGLW